MYGVVYDPLTLSKYLGRSLAMVSAVAGETSDGLMMTQLPAAMAPVRETEAVVSLQGVCCVLAP